MRYFLFTVAALLMPSLVLAQGQGMATFSLAPERGSYNVGESFSVQVMLNAPELVTSLRASVLYDASQLTLVSIGEEKGNFPYWWENGFRPGSAAGEVMLQASAPTPGVQGSSLPVATLNFRAKNNGLAALLASQDSLVLTSNDTNVLDATKPVGAIFTIGSVLVPTSPVVSFDRNLQRSMQGADVRALQQFLNAQGFLLAAQGPGSLGQETDYFGSLTEAALVRFQEAHAAQILAPWGLQQGTGYFGSTTRAYINSSY